MRVAVVFFGGKRRNKILEIAKALVRGIEAQGHRADVIDGDRDVNTRLTIYQYIVVGTEAVSTIKGKIPDKVGTFLSGAGQVTGKRSYAFVLKSFISAPRALARLMQAMEKEGLFLKNSTILNSTVEAEEIGKRLHINA
jgi:flavorubredoxin